MRGHEEDRLDHSRAPVYTCVELRGLTSAANLGSRCRPFPPYGRCSERTAIGLPSLYRTYRKTAGRGKVTARVASVRAALSGAITNDVDQAGRLDVLGGCYRVLGDAMDSTWAA